MTCVCLWSKALQSLRYSLSVACKGSEQISSLALPSVLPQNSCPKTVSPSYTVQQLFNFTISELPLSLKLSFSSSSLSMFYLYPQKRPSSFHMRHFPSHLQLLTPEHLRIIIFILQEVLNKCIHFASTHSYKHHNSFTSIILANPKCLLKTIFSKWKQKKTKYPLKTNEQTNKQTATTTTTNSRNSKEF